jgi:hypothetical protein
LEQGWPTVEEFVDTLGRAIDKESVQIKETSLDSDKKFERAVLDYHDGANNSLVIVEGEDCVSVPATIKKHPHQITIGDVKREVWKVEERFQSGELTTLVCHLKPAPPAEEEA